VPWDVEKGETSASLGMGLKIGLDKDLDSLVAGVNFDADRCIAEIDFVPTTIVSSKDRVRHFGPAPLTRPVVARQSGWEDSDNQDENSSVAADA
jgi:hypothetical protein